MTGTTRANHNPVQTDNVYRAVRLRPVRGTTAVLVAICVLTLGGVASAQSAQDVETMRRQLVEQASDLRELRTLTEQQRATLDQLDQQIERLTARLGELERTSGTTAPAAQPSPAAGQVAAGRDPVGDLNAELVAAGDFPGSFRIPGSDSVSLAFGGFVKAVAIADSAAEALGADMLPSTLGTRRADTGGNFALDATITRLHIDGRAPTPSGGVRAYVEYDLNATNDGSLGFKLRHAYGTWRTGAGTLTAGHTWSTGMDLRIIPEGLTEPTVSGAIFSRQALLRWSWPETHGFTVHVAVEDPSSADLSTHDEVVPRSVAPDVIGGIEYGRPAFHLRANAIVRRLEVADNETGDAAAAAGWGLAASGWFALSDRDQAAFGLAHGPGVGRYLLGLSGGSAGLIAQNETNLRLRHATGGLVWYRHHWNARARSTVAATYAQSDVFDLEGDGAFRSTTYVFGNLMWSVARYASVGVEYDFGRRRTRDGSQLDNHRVMFGLQVF